VITLVLGGTRSGKSEVAERLAGGLSPPVTYVATTVVPEDDADLAARVERHRRRRPAAWRTVEAGPGLVPALDQVSGSVVVDSLGAWVAACDALAPDADALTRSLQARRGDAVVVSDEVGLGVHPSSEAGRRFRDALGQVNRAVADIADEVLLVVAGRVLPLDPLPADERQEEA
jgi:adenosylcobinamide kinase / adenosylcobinamide-phosphate guanylyltransferase